MGICTEPTETQNGINDMIKNEAEMEEAKVEILTFHWTINFGGLLQAYALQETIRGMGFSTEFINYHNKKDLMSVSNWKRRILQKIWDRMARAFFGREKRERITEKFRERYLSIPSPEYTSCESLKEKYHNGDALSYAYVVGSDQVWNPDLTGDPNAYLFSFLPSGCRKIAYAASFGKGCILDTYRKTFQKELPGFSSVSVREEDGSKLVHELAGIDAPAVMDPVFFLTAREWKRLASDRMLPDDYILCYYMNTPDRSVSNGIASLARALAQKHHCRIVNIGKKEYEKVKFWQDNLFDIGPCEFVSLIANARFVVTNSFHATAFSVIFHTPFFVPVNYEEPEKLRLSNRMESLVKKLGCKERIMACPINRRNAASFIQEADHMDFSDVDAILKKEIEKSKFFLREALMKEQKEK